MKKLNLFKTIFTILTVVASLMYFNSCKSSDATIVEVDALSVLEENSAVYVKIPVAHHQEFTKKLLCLSVPGIKESNADYLIPKINTVCVGFGNSADKNQPNRVQISADGYLPPIAVKSALTEKNGWIAKKFETSTYYENSETDFKLGLCSLKNIVFAKDVEPLLTRYNKQVEAIETTGMSLAPSENWTGTTYNFLSDPSEDIRFCVLAPQGFLNNLLGIEMRFAIACATGSLSSKDDGTYNLSLNIEFQNKQVVQAARVALYLFYGNKAKFEAVDSTLKVVDVNLSMDQMLKLFGSSIQK